MKQWKRILGVLLILAMLASLVPSALAAETYRWPVPSSKSISQKYGGSHVGIDITGSKGCDVVATKSGTVYYVYKGCINSNALSTGVSCTTKGCSPNCGTYSTSGMKICNWGYGNGVVIKHSDGSGYSMYAHMNSVSVSKGATVSRGQKIGTMGSAGKSTGTHLHFEMATGMSMSGTYCKPSGNINTNTSAISYDYSTGVVSGGASTVVTPNVQFTLPTDSNYTSKQKVTNTNAVVVNKITKPSGTTVSQMGVILYDANGKQLKKYTEKVSNVGASTKVYHSWYDINSEVKYTLTPGTTYKYKFWGTFNGVDVISSTAYSFKTTGTAPAQTYTAKIYLNSDYSALYTKSVTQGQAYGVLPTAYGKDGYTFDGYYTAKTGGTKVTSSTIFNGTSDITLYPRYTQNVVEEPEVPQQYTVYLYMNGYVYKTLTVTNGSTYGTLPSPNLSGYDFLGWYTKVSGGTKITSSTKVNLTGSQTLYARFEEIPEEGGTITLQIGNPRLTVNGVSKPIDDGGTVPVIRNDRTLLPVRAVIEAMDGTVGWDNSTRTVSLTKDGKTLYLQINSTLCVDSSGKYYALDSAPIILNDRTMLPIRFVVEYFGGTVGWNGNTRTVTIQY